jgi:Fe-S-cluster containining protein
MQYFVVNPFLIILGMTRDPAGTDPVMNLADNREFTEGEFLSLESDKSPDKAACPDCHCVFLDSDTNLRWAKCSEKRKMLCEHKGKII